MSRIVLCTVAPAVAFAVAGCGGPGTIDRAQVEKKVQAGLSKTAGQQAPAATCPGDLKQEVGATMRCYIDFPEEKERLGVTVKVKGPDGNDFTLSIVADEKLTKQP